MMVNFNNRDGYKTLGVENFTDYLVGFVVSMLVNIIAFFVTMLLAWLVIRGIIAALDLCARIPFLYSANRLGGLVVGLAEGLFFIWLLLLIISMFSCTVTGAKILGMVSEYTALAPILEWNIFLRIVTGAITRIM